MTWATAQDAENAAHHLMEQVMEGDAALNVLNNPVIQKAYDGVEAAWTEAMILAETDEERNKFRLRIVVLREVRNIMTSAVTTAKQAEQRRRTGRQD